MIVAFVLALAAVVLVVLLLVPPRRPRDRRSASLGVLRIRRARSK